ncbi:MFS transporter [Ureibacillus sinduriensis]|uniref:Major facilitator superfamily (MFS) profile domain-containing protein n=1 Tax=Ureibacillus sinduriensis BLB-1 = JCM 15800 TaxID=1384057 RepID=A0A0A3HZT1_9BACL|nr:MFS transporter [Ureibacillus sinduriensis]KGR77949.1 hypothetical protein CD33_01870 [Ureibacillus sinduriensis BLB-1 = JCM 15800]
MKWSKQYVYLLTGLGVSQLGNWIYLIALNVMIWNLTHSPAAIAGLYIIGPIVRFICNIFVGSFIDRWNKKKTVVTTDLIRGILVFLMPFADQLWLIYTLVGVTNIASTFFGPSSTYLISVHVLEEHKQRFNALHSTLSSGSFMIGPALAGLILATFSISVAMWVNGVTFFVCAYLLSLLPSENKKNTSQSLKISLLTIKEDWQMILTYSKKLHSFTQLIVIYSIALMIAFALDSQEMTFLLSHFEISESLYGFTVTFAGIGAIAGGLLATVFAKTFSIMVYLKGGFLLSMLSYLGFYLANSYVIAVLCFVTLGIFMAFSNTGFATLYQTTIHPDVMGRFSSVLNLIQSILQVLFTIVIGLLAEWYALKWTAVIFASFAVLLAMSIAFIQLKNNKPS